MRKLVAINSDNAAMGRTRARLEAHGGRAVRGDDDDRVGSGTLWHQHRVGQPAQDGRVSLRVGRADQRADGFDLVERVTAIAGPAPGPAASSGLGTGSGSRRCARGGRSDLSAVRERQPNLGNPRSARIA
jgi:hypothetical protein